MAAALRRNPRFPLSRNSFSTLSAQFRNKPPPSATASSDSISLVKSAIRSESDPDRIAELFQSSTHSRLFYGDRTIYKFSIQKLAQSRRPDLIERLLEQQQSDPSTPKSEGFHIRIIILYSDAGMVDHAVRTFDRMADIGCRRTERSLCALLTVFLKNQKPDRLRKSFNRATQDLGITPGISAHNIFLKGLCTEDDVTAARLVLDEMEKKGLKPDIISYNTVLNGYLKKGDEAGFEEILKEINKKGLNPNVVTYNCRIAHFCEKGRSFAAEELLDVMSSKGVQPNRFSFNTLINGFCKEGDVESAMRIFKRMQAMKEEDSRGASANFETYIVLIRSLVEKEEFGSALKVFKECLARKWAPPFGSVKGLVEGLIKNSQLKEAKDVVAKMRKAVKGDAMDAWKKVEVAFSF